MTKGHSELSAWEEAQCWDASNASKYQKSSAF